MTVKMAFVTVFMTWSVVRAVMLLLKGNIVQ